MNIFHFAHHFHTRAIARAGFFTHEQNYYNIYSQTQLGDIVHEQTIICKQLFAGLVLGSRPMKNSRNKYSRKGVTLRDPTTQCFHIRQKCLKWFFLCFSDLFGSFGATLKTIYLFGCLYETMVVSKVLGPFYVLFKTKRE